LFPNLPRCSLRALSGYFGRAVGALRRSTDHVEATAFVWRELIRVLEMQGVSTWGALHNWLARPAKPTTGRRRVWPMPRDVRFRCHMCLHPRLVRSPTGIDDGPEALDCR